MKLYRDKVWEEMDWLTKAVEPYVFTPFKLFGNILPRHQITEEMIENIVVNGDLTIDQDSLLMQYVTTYNKDFFNGQKTLEDHVYAYLKNKMHGVWEPFRGISISFDITDGAYYDITSQKLNGEVYINVNFNPPNDDVIKEYVPQFVSHYLSSEIDYIDKIPYKRLLEINSILGVKKTEKTKSYKKLKAHMRSRIREIFENDEWKIRNLDLIMFFTAWLRDYLATGNQKALINISTLKFMTHNGNPIYSMEIVE